MQAKRKLMLGQSTSMQRVYENIQRLAPVQISILILGETGTGKELCAREIHNASSVGKGPFVALNVAAIPENLLEAELFGYRKGAFTGAMHDHMGYVERAGGGTLFIDEIGELPLHLQSKLLRVLQEKQVVRVGETNPRTVKFRLVSATHRDLPSKIKSGEFREDLYYRIGGAMIALPPLRERGEDVVMLAHHFRDRFCQVNELSAKPLSETAMHRLRDHQWSGNVRELENVVERASVMADGGEIRSRDLAVVAPVTEQAAGLGDELEPARHQFLKRHIETVLRKFDGHRGKTALALGVSRRTLTRYLDELNLT